MASITRLCVASVRRSYEIVVTMDQDLQHPPEEIPLLVGKVG